VARRKSLFLVVAFAAFCLALGYWWSLRIGLPLGGEKPWWYGKDAHVRMQVLEPGQDVATVSMRLPKGFVDTMVALGTDAKIQVEGKGASIGVLDRGHTIRLRDVWKQLQRLPRGEKLKFEEEGATITMWIEAT